MLTRRSCLLLPLWLVSSAALVPTIALASPETAVLASWLPLLSERAAADRLGVQLDARLQADAIDHLLTEAAGTLRPRQPSAETLKRILAEEFRAGRSLAVDGFLFSRTEVALLLYAARRGHDT
jgi:hypothetical protein